MKINKLHGQGNHLIIDGTSNAKLNDKEFIRNFLIKTTKKIKMKAISKPLVVKYNSKKEPEAGITGTIILAESNITIHTYPLKKWFALDIYSCNEFPIENVIK